MHILIGILIIIILSGCLSSRDKVIEKRFDAIDVGECNTLCAESMIDYDCASTNVFTETNGDIIKCVCTLINCS